MTVVLDRRAGLTERIRQVVPGAEIVRVTATRNSWGNRPRAELRYVALVLDARRQTLRVPPGGIAAIVRQLQAAYPTAVWTGTQCWTAAASSLAPWRPTPPAHAREALR